MKFNWIKSYWNKVASISSKNIVFSYLYDDLGWPLRNMCTVGVEHRNVSPLFSSNARNHVTFGAKYLLNMLQIRFFWIIFQCFVSSILEEKICTKPVLHFAIGKRTLRKSGSSLNFNAAIISLNKFLSNLHINLFCNIEALLTVIITIRFCKQLYDKTNYIFCSSFLAHLSSVFARSKLDLQKFRTKI